ncbi:MAG: Gram-negative bacterial tonB protein [Syntrophorhabdaceae bacterium PtaU1.Bin034]|nr:MAG: Gram-negative bacterial tonB protein [Syntrophorhabdaceae bacterium PtaU1.Bin034]
MTPSRVTVQSSRRYVPSAGPRPAGLTRTSAVINDGSEEAGETAFPPGTDSVSVTAIDSDGQTPSPSEEMSPGIRSGTEGPSGPTTAVSGLTKRGPPGGEGGVNTIAATYGKECFVFIRNAIMKKLSYPALARRKGWSGTVKVSFVVHEDGTADDIRVARSSGFEILDMSSLDAVRRASPFPKPPAAVHVIMPIAYRLTDG